jgi:hypothetical protein
VAVQVTAGDRTDTIIAAREARPCEAGGVASDGAFAVWSEKGGALEKAYLVGGKALRKGNVGLEAAAGEWRGTIAKVDYKKKIVVVQPAAPYPAALAGRYVRITNEFNDCMHLITAARNLGDATELALALDPRIGEGPVEKANPGFITSGVTLGLGDLRYYHGKTLTNEDGSAVYRLSGVTGQKYIYVDPAKHGAVPTEKLEKEFADLDGDGLKRFLIYDYGVGDAACVSYAVSLQKEGPQEWVVESPVAVTVSLPGQKPVTMTPRSDSCRMKISFSGK